MSSSVAPASPSISVVYIEDDLKLARLTEQYLTSNGVQVSVYSEPRAGIAAGVRERPDVVLLDLMLPEMDGLEVCRQLRAKVATSIIMVTARGQEVDRVLGLETGADDYIAKPFSPRELLARIRAQARRSRGQTRPQEEIVVGPLRIDLATRTVMLDDTEMSLTTYEFELLRVLAERPGRVLSREHLIESVRGSADEAFDRSVDVRISRLRQKLGDNPRHARLLKTIRGVGYTLVPPRT
ncbi:Phosphate regulon transcriptional regulatory protein PhoB (SphR) [Labilithrix luteola]|uniref:Phosphate regulon transcriptional regulatory protein PhoB (SphR) n=1 Tax=Labilithrix luteola TaxID=1391654 RepID=A0A0K1Q4H6_9BACT|nr:response regulator transcription factor [Labilithrix luteola]AKV00290.1 Phosphate regulon transcriptional regulatory protein PhoB (SphR) [Labilithrix luteola]